jgi:hypothetical protein
MGRNSEANARARVCWVPAILPISQGLLKCPRILPAGQSHHTEANYKGVQSWDGPDGKLLFAKGLKSLGPKWVGIGNHLVTSKEGSRWGTEKETMDVLQFYGFVNGFVQFLKKYFDFAKVS